MDREELLSHHDELANGKTTHGKEEPRLRPVREETNRLQTLPELRRWAFAQPSRDFLVRVVDKVSRMSTFTSAGKLEVENETVEDAIVDIINYMVLFSAYLKDKDKS